ncbi:hypothetical protein A7C99_0578 [Trichophyton rubrum]|uniref:BZIP domain-containing protein n=1 Tax=Trichophyton rubrum TaxID=5551 RepID=A0A178F6U3_TRIRU|nr:hypothetical protein A7C99_0578 [Trichophyton rubrum]
MLRLSSLPSFLVLCTVFPGSTSVSLALRRPTADLREPTTEELPSIPSSVRLRRNKRAAERAKRSEFLG